MEKKRKLIDLDESTFKILSMQAVSKGTNLKSLIEDSLKNLAENLEDIALYSELLKKSPEGKELLNSKEKNDFENWLGV
jgi:hypothetical protein